MKGLERRGGRESATGSSRRTSLPNTCDQCPRSHQGPAESDLRARQLRLRRCCWPIIPGRDAHGERPAAKDGTLVFETNMDGVEMFVDGKSQGVVNKSDAAASARAEAGQRITIQGVKMGYEPDGPREELVYPGANHDGIDQDSDCAAPEKGGVGRASTRAGALQQGLRSTITESRCGRFREGAADRSEVQPGRAVPGPHLQLAIR